MKARNLRLVLECVILATELVRLATQILALLGTALNYPHDIKVGNQIRT